MSSDPECCEDSNSVGVFTSKVTTIFKGSGEVKWTSPVFLLYIHTAHSTVLGLTGIPVCG